MMPCCLCSSRNKYTQHGSALLFALVMMAVLATMALSAVDSALLGTQAAMNYRDHDRVFHTAESLVFALDSALLEQIESDGLSPALDGLSGAEVEIVMSPALVKQTGTAVVGYQTEAAGFIFDFSSATDATDVVCGPLYRVSVRASDSRQGAEVTLGLERLACCDNKVACEAGDFVSLSRLWRRLQ